MVTIYRSQALVFVPELNKACRLQQASDRARHVSTYVSAQLASGSFFLPKKRCFCSLQVLERIKQGYQYLLPSICMEVCNNGVVRISATKFDILCTCIYLVAWIACPQLFKGGLATGVIPSSSSGSKKKEEPDTQARIWFFLLWMASKI